MAGSTMEQKHEILHCSYGDLLFRIDLHSRMQRHETPTLLQRVAHSRTGIKATAKMQADYLLPIKMTAKMQADYL
eukprot:4468108-Pleurochrysis_carterae.AAC.1